MNRHVVFRCVWVGSRDFSGLIKQCDFIAFYRMESHGSYQRKRSETHPILNGGPEPHSPLAQKAWKRLGVLQSKLYFLTQFFTAMMIFDARTPINALPKPLSIFLKISTLPQTICFCSPNAQNWYTHCSNAYKFIDFEWKTPSRFDHFQTQCFYKKTHFKKHENDSVFFSQNCTFWRNSSQQWWFLMRAPL